MHLYNDDFCAFLCHFNIDNIKGKTKEMNNRLYELTY